MKTQLVATTATLALLLGGATALAPAASAAKDSPGCVTQGEFRQAKKNLTIKRVHRLFDTAGKRSSVASGGGYRIEIRSYRTCSPYGSVAVAYENGRLSTKSAVF